MFNFFVELESPFPSVSFLEDCFFLKPLQLLTLFEVVFLFSKLLSFYLLFFTKTELEPTLKLWRPLICLIGWHCSYHLHFFFICWSFHCSYKKTGWKTFQKTLCSKFLNFLRNLDFHKNYHKKLFIFKQFFLSNSFQFFVFFSFNLN